MTRYEPLTPNLREQILDSISNKLSELDGCNDNWFVRTTRDGLICQMKLFKSIPDGYPIPLEDRRNV